jgi:hypothetical protein
MKNIVILGIILGFAFPSYGQLLSTETVIISGDTLEVEKVLYLTDTLMSIRKNTETDYFSVQIEKGKVTSLFSSTEKEKVYLSYHLYAENSVEYASFSIINSSGGWNSRSADKKEQKIIRKRIRQIEKEYLKYI